MAQNRRCMLHAVMLFPPCCSPQVHGNGVRPAGPRRVARAGPHGAHAPSRRPLRRGGRRCPNRPHNRICERRAAAAAVSLSSLPTSICDACAPLVSVRLFCLCASSVCAPLLSVRLFCLCASSVRAPLVSVRLFCPCASSVCAPLLSVRLFCPCASSVRAFICPCLYL
jgi:hypothetical protein